MRPEGTTHTDRGRRGVVAAVVPVAGAILLTGAARATTIVDADGAALASEPDVAAPGEAFAVGGAGDAALELADPVHTARTLLRASRSAKAGAPGLTGRAFRPLTDITDALEEVAVGGLTALTSQAGATLEPRLAASFLTGTFDAFELANTSITFSTTTTFIPCRATDRAARLARHITSVPRLTSIARAARAPGLTGRAVEHLAAVLGAMRASITGAIEVAPAVCGADLAADHLAPLDAACRRALQTITAGACVAGATDLARFTGGELADPLDAAELAAIRAERASAALEASAALRAELTARLADACLAHQVAAASSIFEASAARRSRLAVIATS